MLSNSVNFSSWIIFSILLSKFEVDFDANSGPLLTMYFDAVVVEVKKNIILFRLTLAMHAVMVLTLVRLYE